MFRRAAKVMRRLDVLIDSKTRELLVSQREETGRSFGQLIRESIRAKYSPPRIELRDAAVSAEVR